MILTPVQSSQIAAMGQENGVTRVQFNNGAVYDYQNVPPEIFQQILTADSVGAMFNQLVKKFPDRYPYKKV